jgi:anti-sigma factor RsiW
MDRQDCQHLLAALGEYIDGTLDEELCREIEKHMAECENCRVVVDTLRKTIYLYHVEAQEESLPQEVRHRLLARLELEG